MLRGDIGPPTMNRWIPLFVTLLTLNCRATPIDARPPAPPPQPAVAVTSEPAVPTQWGIVNVMPAWWTYWEKAEKLPRSQQVALFKSELVSPRPELFVHAIVGRDPTQPLDLDAQITAFLDTVPSLVSTMRQLSDSIERELPAHRRSFMAAFPEFSWNGKVYFTISLDAFDGAIREIAGVPQLLFGIDKIARLHGSRANLAPLFHHELFHILHLVTGNPFDPTKKNHMYQALWGEGLAVHVAKSLNPEATARQLVLSDEMIEQARGQLPQLAAEMLQNIDSQDATFYRDWFRGSGQRQDIPNRVGYYLGLRVAQRMGETRNLQALAELKDPELRSAIAVALSDLAGG